MDLYDATLRAQIAQITKNIFDTGKRTMQFRFYLKAKEVVVSDPNYMSDFDELDNSYNDLVPVYADFDVCLIYLDRQPFSDFIKGDDSNIRFKSINNRIRIQVEADAFEYLKEAERFVFGDEKYSIDESWRKIGPLADFQIYEIVLQRVV